MSSIEEANENKQYISLTLPDSSSTDRPTDLTVPVASDVPTIKGNGHIKIKIGHRPRPIDTATSYRSDIRTHSTKIAP